MAFSSVVADLQVLLSRGQCGSGGCGRSSQCSDRSHLASSSTVPCGGSVLLPWKVQWPPSLITVSSSFPQWFGGAVQGLGFVQCGILSGNFNLFCHFAKVINGSGQFEVTCSAHTSVSFMASLWTFAILHTSAILLSLWRTRVQPLRFHNWQVS